jgi:hypothetical protein
MTYPSQPGYPTPQYGGQSPQPQRQNNLWLIGGAVIVVLVIIMTVILLVVQRTQSSNSSDDGDTTAEEDNSGDDTEQSAMTMSNDACDAYDLTLFEDAYGEVDTESTYRSYTSSNGLDSLDCSFYNPDATSVNVGVNDYESAEDAAYWVESDEDYYNAEQGYDFSDYTAYGDAGSMYSTEDTETGTKTIYIHVAVGSLEITVYTTLWSDEGIDEAAAIAAMEDLVQQSGELFVDYQ